MYEEHALSSLPLETAASSPAHSGYIFAKEKAVSSRRLPVPNLLGGNITEETSLILLSRSLASPSSIIIGSVSQSVGEAVD